ncbi:hypothetical protein P8918_13630 [Bacillus spizizenii]|nr:hypothetical protein [Bacillus spizizenii]MCY8890345.1 hypothetical protein [Bacillus spizizenii]MEC0842069.1 hypothetical protein [Bacillus spizizenii]
MDENFQHPTPESEEVKKAANSLKTPTAFEEAGILEPDYGTRSDAVLPKSPPSNGEVPEAEGTTKNGTKSEDTSDRKQATTDPSPKKKSPDGAPPNKKTTIVEKAKARRFSKLGLASTAMNIGVGALNFNSNLNEGDGVVGAAVKATAETAVSSVVGHGKFLAGLGLMKAPEFLVKGYESINQQTRALEMSGRNRPFQGNTFVDTQQTFTMRQSAVAMMQQSKYNVENAMQGNEASFLHR